MIRPDRFTLYKIISMEYVATRARRNEYEDPNKNLLRKIIAEVLKNVEDERIDDTIDSGN